MFALKARGLFVVRVYLWDLEKVKTKMFAQTHLWKNAFEFDYRIYSNKRRSLGSMSEEKQNQDNIWLISTHKMNIAFKKDIYIWPSARNGNYVLPDLSKGNDGIQRIKNRLLLFLSFQHASFIKITNKISFDKYHLK